MKKILSMLIAITLVAVLCVPALASESAPIFSTAFVRVENTPTVAHDEWDIPYNVWTIVADNAPVAIGDTVTMVLTYTVPAEVAGYDSRLLGSIEYLTEISGINEIELVEATGCNPRLNCDYEIGICVPVPGEYANITHEGTTLKVMAELGSTVSVVVRGIATAEHVTGSMNVTIGQHTFPAYFYEKVVDKKAEGCYNVHWSDLLLVQKRSVEFRPGNIFVGLNNHYYRMHPDQGAPGLFIPVNENFEDNGDPFGAVGDQADLFLSLNSILSEAMQLFNFNPHSIQFTDETFIGSGEHFTFEYPYDFGANGSAEPTEAPAEPTEAPAEPTEAPAEPTAAPTEPTAAPAEPTATPAEPTDVPVPATGTISLAVIGIASAVSGAAVLFSRRKDG